MKGEIKIEKSDMENGGQKKESYECFFFFFLSFRGGGYTKQILSLINWNFQL